MIITDKNKITQVCEPCKSVEEGEKIGAKLLKELSDKGVGLAANQIGIDSRVCVINVKEPIVLINPKIIRSSDEDFIFPEKCLSFPNKLVKTKRNVEVVVLQFLHPLLQSQLLHIMFLFLLLQLLSFIFSSLLFFVFSICLYLYIIFRLLLISFFSLVVSL